MFKPTEARIAMRRFAEKYLVNHHYIPDIERAIDKIDEGKRPDIDVRTLDGTSYQLRHGQLHPEGPEPIYLPRKDGPFKDPFGTLRELLGTVESDVAEAKNLHDQLYPSKDTVEYMRIRFFRIS